MRKCELCEGVARMYCESDQASLCWDCDEKVHRANFLVAKHLRSLLCHVCQSITPWKASGQKLGPTVSVCDTCVASADCKVHDDRSVEQDNQSGGGDGDDEENDHVDDVDGVDETEEDEDEDDYDDEDEDDENQVVPWSGDSQSTPPPPPVASSSCSSSEDGVSLKRMRDFADFYSDDEIGCASSQVCSEATGNEEANSSLSSYRPLKQTRTTTVKQQDHGQADSRSTAIIRSLQSLQKQIITKDGDASAAILGICQLSRDQNR